jgi:hypothetical protein
VGKGLTTHCKETACYTGLQSWTDSLGLDSSVQGKGPVVGLCEHGSETLRSIKGGEFLD